MNQHAKTPLLGRLARLMRLAMKVEQAQIPLDEYEALNRKQRREFIKNAGKAALALGGLSMLHGCSKDIESAADLLQGRRSLNKKKSSPDIAIIGAGIAGLHAAWLLKQKGVFSTLYEASNRTGGRMYSGQNLMAPGLTTELGAEFIDTIHKDMLMLAKTFNLELIDTRTKRKKHPLQEAYFVNGSLFTEEQVIQAFLPFATLIKRDQQSLSGTITVDSFTPFDAMIDQMSIAQYFDRIGLGGWLRALLDVAYVIEFGQPTDKQTALNFLWLISPKVQDKSFEIFGVSDERFKIKGGNQQICDRLADQLPGQIEKGHVLRAIQQQSDNRYRLVFETADRTKEVLADMVLLTLPFTMLREVEVQPQWPEWKRKAIFDIGYGDNSKMMLGFNQRYWNDLGYDGNFFADNFLQSGWENSLLQPGNPGGLTIYSGGEQALLVGQGTAASQAALHLPALEAIFPGAAAQYNGQAHRFVWPTHPWTKCSYTCFTPGQYTTIAGNEIKPVGNIFFAGEHCSYEYQGYMNGGAETGRRAAEAMLKTIK